jgi:DNA invertase Pin-like site-specific DNA recombinase
LRYSERDLHTAAVDKSTFQLQRAEVEAFANVRGWVNAGWDEEPSVSGAAEDIALRPAFQKHLTDAAAGKFEVSLCFMSDRWARDTAIGLESLKRLRRAGVFWATADGRWDINKVIEDGFSIAFVVDSEVNAQYARKVSQKAIVARRLRARAGYHNGRVAWGYQRPTPPPPPPDAPYNWRPPRAPAEPHAINFTRLQQIGEWAAAGMSDREIASRATQAGWVLEHRHKGRVTWGKPFLAMLLTNPFPREFAPGSGKGTIITPDGERVEGQHVAAWSWDLWHRMDEARKLNQKGTRGRAPTAGIVRIFSGLAVCAACGRPLHHQLRHGSVSGFYSTYLCQSSDTGYTCSVRTAAQPKTGSRGTRGYRGLRSKVLEEQFAALVLNLELPPNWRETMVAEVNRLQNSGKLEEAAEWRANLQEERKRILLQHRHGRISDEEMLDETARIDGLLSTLPAIERWDAEREQRITAADTLAGLLEYWNAGSAEKRAEFLRSIVDPSGLAVDLEEQTIRRIKPRPMFALTFKALLADQWREIDDGWFVRV